MAEEPDHGNAHRVGDMEGRGVRADDEITASDAPDQLPYRIGQRRPRSDLPIAQDGLGGRLFPLSGPSQQKHVESELGLQRACERYVSVCWPILCPAGGAQRQPDDGRTCRGREESLGCRLLLLRQSDLPRQRGRSLDAYNIQELQEQILRVPPVSSRSVLGVDEPDSVACPRGREAHPHRRAGEVGREDALGVPLHVECQVTGGCGAKGVPKIVYTSETSLRPEDDYLVHRRVMFEDLCGCGLGDPDDFPGGTIAFEGHGDR